MEAEFWHERWGEGRIGFHQGTANRMLVGHLGALGLKAGARVFVPLCGKTKDIGWLLGRGYRVVGAELSAVAIDQLFEDLAIQPERQGAGSLERRSAPGLDIFVGDFFDLDKGLLGPVDGVFDRAALVALPLEMRVRYAAHLGAITERAPQLLVTFDYDQAAMDGPPFSVPEGEVATLYGEDYRIDLLASEPVTGGLKGEVAAEEIAWHLR